jgi:hypothetical protein
VWADPRDAPGTGTRGPTLLRTRLVSRLNPTRFTVRRDSARAPTVPRRPREHPASVSRHVCRHRDHRAGTARHRERQAAENRPIADTISHAGGGRTALTNGEMHRGPCHWTSFQAQWHRGS